MAYLAFYRTFRPASFDTVVRQEHIVRTLKNQIESGKIGHAYLFCGPRGTGKTTLAKIFARAINCENPRNGSPCGKCETCKALADGKNIDVNEIDAASNNGVDEMRDLREKVQYPPVAGKYKVYIIDEVHMLTASAFNAVLKTLEEPPRHAVFILATTEPQKIPATILSRCMRFDFKLIPQKDLENLIKDVLQKSGKEYEDEAVAAIARAGAGSARDSLSIADMCASYSAGKLTYDDVNSVLGSADFYSVAGLAESVLKEDAQSALTAVEEALSTGKSAGVLVRDLLAFLNNCAIAKICKNAKEIINLPEERFDAILKIANAADGHKILRVSELLAKAENDLKYSSSGKITLETAILKCAMPQTDYNLDALIGKIGELERKLKEGVEVKVKAQTAGLEKPTAPALQKQAAEEKPVSIPGKKTEAKKPMLEADDGVPPFEKVQAGEAVQPALWDTPAAADIAKPGSLSDGEKAAVFGKLIRSFRTTRKNAVLFTLCMDLGNFFEGEKLILTTDSEAVFKGLTRPDNASFIAETLAEFGVSEHETRLVEKGESEFEKALRELKTNFDGTDIQIK